MEAIVERGSGTPVVSWIICAHVLNDQLLKALESCLNQTYINFELLLVANGSAADEISRAVEKWFGLDSRVRIFTTPVRHLNFSLALGLHYSRGKYIARMDSDDIARIDRLELQLRFMNANPMVVLLGTAYDIIDANGARLRTIAPPQSNGKIRRALLWGNPICHPSVMFRRADALEVGGYLGGLHAEDYDLWLRLSSRSEHQFAMLDRVCLGYRENGVGTARRSRQAYANVAAAQLRHFISYRNPVWLVAALITVIKAFIFS